MVGLEDREQDEDVESEWPGETGNELTALVMSPASLSLSRKCTPKHNIQYIHIHTWSSPESL